MRQYRFVRSLSLSLSPSHAPSVTLSLSFSLTLSLSLTHTPSPSHSPGQVIRDMFKRIVIHVIHQLRPKTPPGLHHSQFVRCGANSKLQSPAPPVVTSSSSSSSPPTVASEQQQQQQIQPALVGGQQPALSTPPPLESSSSTNEADGSHSSSSSSSSSSEPQFRLPTCITRFVATLLGLLNSTGRKWTKNLSEYFALLLDFAALGAEEKRFLNGLDTVAGMAAFYLGQKAPAADGAGSAGSGGGKGTGGAGSVQVNARI